MITHEKLIRVEDYAPYIGRPAVDRILKKAAPLKGLSVVNVNATFYGGGVAELMMSMTLLMNSLGLKCEWQTIIGHPAFFDITKSFHNALQSDHKFKLTPKIKRMYEDTLYENSQRMNLDNQMVVIHDPQPLAMIKFHKKHSPWIWRCHIDLSDPHRALWKYLSPYVNMYDAAIFSIKEYKQKLDIPQYLFMPATDPFNKKNRRMPNAKMKSVLRKYKIPTDKPIVTQISRFDLWKDPEGVIKAYKLARKKVDCTLVMLGNAATDDPEGSAVFKSLLKYRDKRTLIMDCGDDVELVNTLQTKAAVVVQKSTKEGFGLTVTEAMVKGSPVIGGKVGGIVYQIADGKNGYLVNSVNQAADRIVKLVKNRKQRTRMGKAAAQSVANNFLMTRLLEQYLDLFRTILKIR